MTTKWITIFYEYDYETGKIDKSRLSTRNINTTRERAIANLVEHKIYYGTERQYEFSKFSELRKDYAFTIEVKDGEINKIDLMPEAKKNFNKLKKEHLIEVLKEQKTHLKQITSNIAKVEKLINQLK